VDHASGERLPIGSGERLPCEPAGGGEAPAGISRGGRGSLATPPREERVPCDSAEGGEAPLRLRRGRRGSLANQPEGGEAPLRISRGGEAPLRISPGGRVRTTCGQSAYHGRRAYEGGVLVRGEAVGTPTPWKN
jgi:hypothetical protein